MTYSCLFLFTLVVTKTVIGRWGGCSILGRLFREGCSTIQLEGVLVRDYSVLWKLLLLGLFCLQRG